MSGDDGAVEYRSQPPKEFVPTWYAEHESSFDDTVRSARMALEATAREQMVHAHPIGQACRDRNRRLNCVLLRRGD